MGAAKVGVDALKSTYNVCRKRVQLECQAISALPRENTY